MRVYVIVEGEIAYYFPYVPHAVFSDPERAQAYAQELVKSSGATRWPNVAVLSYELDQPGHIEEVLPCLE